MKNATIYLGSSILNKMIPFLILPIMTEYLTPKEYGKLSIFLILISLYSAFIGMALQTNISKNFFRVSKDEMSLYIGNMLVILFLSSVFYFGITFVATHYFNEIFSIPSYLLLLIPLIVMMTMVNEINTTILRNEQKAVLFGIFEIGNTFIKMTLTIIFLIYFALNWRSQIYAMLVGSGIFFIIGLIYIYQKGYLALKIDKEKIEQILSVSLPLIPHILGGVIIAVSDRLFIEKMVGLDAVGIYSIGYMFGMVIMLFSDAFIKAWSPWFYRYLTQLTHIKKKQIVQYTYLYIAGIFLLSFFVSWIGNMLLPYMVDAKYYDAGKYIFWVALGYAIFGVYQIFFPYLVHLNKTSYLAFSTVVAAGLNLIFNYFFIKSFGAIGAAYATVLAFSVSAGLVFIYQYRQMAMPWFGIFNKKYSK
jgi:O-antigen/teichoic acid export membrane protein